MEEKEMLTFSEQMSFSQLRLTSSGFPPEHENNGQFRVQSKSEVWNNSRMNRIRRHRLEGRGGAPGKKALGCYQSAILRFLVSLSCWLSGQSERIKRNTRRFLQV